MTINILLAVLSGLLTGLSFNVAAFSWFVWFSLIPLFFALKKCSLRECLTVGLVFSLCYYGTAIFWISYVTKLGLFFLLAYLSLYGIVFVLFGRYFLNKSFNIVNIPCLWVILEFLKENVWCGFGWANLGYSQYQNIYLIQSADLFGTKFISFLIVLTNILIWGLIYHIKKYKFQKKYFKKIIFRLSFLLVIFLATIFYSFYRLNVFNNTSKQLKVAIAQPDIPQELKWKPYAEVTIVEKLTFLAKAAEKDALLIFPEASWPYVVEPNNYLMLESFIKEAKRDILIGAVLEEKTKFYNAALLFDRRGQLISSYRKINLVPFGEYVPLRDFLSFISVFNSLGDTSRGVEITKFPYQGGVFSVLICFEDSLPRFASNLAQGSDFLVNITNDAWFYGEPEASQHFAIMTFRAIENRISIIRSANTGISGWVSPTGKIERFQKKSKCLFTSGVQSFLITLCKERSFYSRHGEILPIFCLLFLGLTILRERFLLKRDKEE